MAIPLFFETPRIVAVLPELGEEFELVELLVRAGLTCQASGAWTLRRVRIVRGSTDLLREPGDVGAVLIGVPDGQTPQEDARLAVGTMAYALMDGVARQSIRGAAWAKPPGVSPG